MKDIKQMYLRGLEAVGEIPSFSRDWRWITLYSICIYAIVLAFRLSFAGRWDHPELWVNGERILATHDAYFWLAKAKGVGIVEGYPLAEAAKFIHNFFGFGLGSIGFWTPAFMGALVGVLCFLWGWLIAGRNAGIIAGLIGSLTPGFFYRSRLGYFDTDLFTLLMPMLVAWLLAYWASKHMKKGWFFSFDKSREREDTQVKTLWMAFAFGLVARFAGAWHYDIVNICILYFFMTAAVLLINGRRGQKIWAFYGLIIYMLAAFPGTAFGQLSLWPFHLVPSGTFGIASSTFVGFMSVISSLLLLFIFKYNAALITSHKMSAWVCGIVFLAVVFATNIAEGPIVGMLQKLSSYLNPAGGGTVEVGTAFAGPVFPSILQSIIEAKLVPLSEILNRGVFVPWLGWLALLSFAVVVFFRPVAVFLLPLIILQLASVKLGIRFSMFGGSAMIVSLGVAAYWLVDAAVRRYSQRQRVGLGVQVLFGIIFLVFCHFEFSKLPLTPVLTKVHAEGLIELGEKGPGDSMIWTWWDWGYATQYYAGLETVVDGGKHAGRDVYPVAFVMTTDSFKKANRMIAFSSQHPSPSPYDLGLVPARSWDEVPRDKIGETLNNQLAQMDYPATAPQYFVITWKDLTISRWITYFGNWNLETGKTKKSTVRLYNPGELGINFQLGAVRNRSGQGGLVSDIDILDWGKVSRRYYGMNAISMKLVPETPYLFINKVTSQSLLTDEMGYDSMMFRLLTGDPADPEISKYFRLVVDNLPFARIYEVVQN